MRGPSVKNIKQAKSCEPARSFLLLREQLLTKIQSTARYTSLLYCSIRIAASFNSTFCASCFVCLPLALPRSFFTLPRLPPTSYLFHTHIISYLLLHLFFFLFSGTHQYRKMNSTSYTGRLFTVPQHYAGVDVEQPQQPPRQHQQRRGSNRGRGRPNGNRQGRAPHANDRAGPRRARNGNNNRPHNGQKRQGRAPRVQKDRRHEPVRIDGDAMRIDSQGNNHRNRRKPKRNQGGRRNDNRRGFEAGTHQPRNHHLQQHQHQQQSQVFDLANFFNQMSLN